MRLLLKLIFGLFILQPAAKAQTCTTPGQNPGTAFPVCGTTKFQQTTVPLCGGADVPVPGCGNGYSDKNPFWYKFTCYETGTLGFLIQPKLNNEDYDWQLFDITNRDPKDVYTDASLFVAANWAGTFGPTGTSDDGVDFTQCGSDPADNLNTFAKKPQILAGHTYILLISHFTDSQGGYDLSFEGGTGVITDPAIPRLKTVEASCGGDILRVKLNKGIKCSSITGDGSDFTLSSPGISILSSTGINCTSKFDTDSILLQLSGPLAPGNYTLGIKEGGDENTLLDYCDNSVPLTDALALTILPKNPTPMDSLVPVSCAPQKLTLVFEKSILCSSIATDGSDFIINGSYPVSVTAATGSCVQGITKEIVVILNQGLTKQGNFSLVLQKGSDGNTITDECSLETPVGSQLVFAVKDTVSAHFTTSIKYGCLRDTIAVFHDGANGVTNWSWDLDDRQQSTTQNAQGIYSVFEEKQIRLAVSNGFCQDSATQNIVLDNFLKADFEAFEDICPLEPVTFTGITTGNINSHLWDFGEGGTANTQATTYTFQAPERQRTFNVRYTVTDAYGCKSSIAKPITIYSSCYLAVPSAFTPNGDGLNDFLAPLNAIKTSDLEFRIFNRWGQLIYTTTDWKRGWDGTLKGQPQPSATYVWMLQYTNRDNGKKQQAKGTAVLIR